MIKLPALLVLFLIQLLLISWGTAIALFKRNKKLNIQAASSHEEIKKLADELDVQKEGMAEFSNLQTLFSELQQKFEQLTIVNAKLKEMIDFLLPEAERSKEFQEILNEVEHNNNELITCIGTLQKENEALNQRKKSFEKEVDGLSRKLRDTVNKEEYQKVLSEKKSLEIKLENLREDFGKKTKDLEKLERNYIYLEKEYNALYKNFKGE